MFGKKVNQRAFEMAGAMMPQIAPETQGAINSYAAMPMPKKSGGFFGQGGFGRTLAGFIGDALLQRDGFDPIYGPAMANQQQLMMKQQMAEADRQAQFDDWRTKYEYERANPKPVAPNDTERDYQFMIQTVGKDAADNWLRRRGDPFINTTLPNGQFYSGPQSGLPQALGAISAPPVAAGAGLPAGYTIRGTSGAPAGGRFRP